MVLYQALSSYQILECIEHRYFFHPNEKSVLLLGTYIVERNPNYKELVSRGFFDEVYLFRYSGYSGNAEKICGEIEKEFLATLPYSFGDFDHFYFAGIHTYLQVYFIRKNIPFEMFEDGSGALSRPEILADIHKRSAPARYEIIRAHHLYDHDTPLITKKYCDMNAQKEDFFDPKAVHFDILERFFQLDQKTQQNIKEFFYVPDLKSEKEDILLLTQQFSNLGQLSFENHVLIYQNLFDYYFKDKHVIIKPHPDDILYYDILFPKARIIKEKFPSELLPTAFSAIPNMISTISSTGTHLVRKYFANRLEFNALYERTFLFNHLYLYALLLCRHLKAFDIVIKGANECQLKNLAMFSSLVSNVFLFQTDLSESTCESICVVDSVCEKDISAVELIEKVDQNELMGIIFLNSQKDYEMYSYKRKDLFHKLIPIVIRKKKISDFEHYDTKSEDVIYFYTRNERLMNMAKDFRETVSLEDTGTELSIAQLTPEQVKIKMLEGILEATEKRLVEYIENEKRLMEELQKYRLENQVSKSE